MLFDVLWGSLSDLPEALLQIVLGGGVAHLPHHPDKVHEVDGAIDCQTRIIRTEGSITFQAGSNDRSWMNRQSNSKPQSHSLDQGGTFQNGASGPRGNKHRLDRGGTWHAGGEESEHQHSTAKAYNKGIVGRMSQHWTKHHQDTAASAKAEAGRAAKGGASGSKVRGGKPTSLNARSPDMTEGRKIHV